MRRHRIKNVQREGLGRLRALVEKSTSFRLLHRLDGRLHHPLVGAALEVKEDVRAISPGVECQATVMQWTGDKQPADFDTYDLIHKKVVIGHIV